MPEPDQKPTPKTQGNDRQSARDGEDTARTAADTGADQTPQSPQSPQPMGWQAYGIIAFLGGVIVAILGIGWQIWFSVDTAMDPFAWWLIGGALVISVLLGGGLLLLLHYSSRHHDHRVYDADHFQKWHRR
ncbi:MAG: hypothetical protein VX152_09235 [Pseudomonadota bacterium]|nr:hypothetical protein [Pseudomonadota bacterium]